MCNVYEPVPFEFIADLAPGGERRGDRHYTPKIGPLDDGPYIVPDGWEVGQWGMIPASSKTRRPTTSAGAPMSTNNARRETMATSWTFGPSWRNGRRCIIPARLWIEPYWGDMSKSIRWAIRRADGQPAGLAGLYAEWTDPATGELVPNYTMITQNADAHPLLSLMHRPSKEMRAVVLLEREDWDAWLHGTPEQAEALIKLPVPGVLASGAEREGDEARVPADVLRMIKSLG